MTLLFQIPEHLNSILVARAAENGKDVESFVIDAICERLEASTECSSSSDFNSWLLEVRTLAHLQQRPSMIPGIRFMLDKVNESTLGYQYLGSAFSAVESGFSQCSICYS